ncbi:MAG: YigZ family protein, partial [Prevotellaceae bacterium]|nr:YigZ family protein [Prevotellaceae bacterium]
EMNPRIVSQNFDNTCEIVLAIRTSLAPTLKSKLGIE